MVTAFTSQRLLPTDEACSRYVQSKVIDRLLNSSLDIGTPVAVIHVTGDNAWAYTIAPCSEGWIRTVDMGFCSRDDMASYLEAEPFIVTVAAKTDLFLDQAMRNHHAFVRMGCRFPAGSPENPGLRSLILPFRGKDGSCVFGDGFISEGDAFDGYLPYTPRTIILQAFRLINSPYGWGDMYGERDCSRFIKEIFSTVGLCLPRNSLQQAKAGRLVAKFDSSAGEAGRLAVLSDNSMGGTMVLHMKGHIMLFLGNVDGDPYAIHDMMEYSEAGPRGEQKRVVNRVVVSNLRIGEGTRAGTFLNRLVTVRAYDK
jgi:hypothetical protein